MFVARYQRRLRFSAHGAAWALRNPQRWIDMPESLSNLSPPSQSISRKRAMPVGAMGAVGRFVDRRVDADGSGTESPAENWLARLQKQTIFRGCIHAF